MLYYTLTRGNALSYRLTAHIRDVRALNKNVPFFFRSSTCYFLLSVFAISSFTYFVLTLPLASLPYPIHSALFILISSYSISVIYASTHIGVYCIITSQEKVLRFYIHYFVVFIFSLFSFLFIFNP
jgi:hypothetical protein